jgi:hypothetical protein
MKKLIILLVIEFLVIVYVTMTCCPFFQADENAWVAWKNHPSSETRAEFYRQRHISELKAFKISGIIFCGLSGFTLLIALALHQKPMIERDEKHSA